MSKADYASKLRDPRWQKKRLEVLNKDGFTCQICHSKSNELQVHHLVYRRNHHPWEYSIYEMITLCNVCHEKHIDDIQSLFAQMTRQAIKVFGNTATLFANDIHGILSGVNVEEYEPINYKHLLSDVLTGLIDAINNYFEIDGFQSGYKSAEEAAKKKQ